MAEYNPKNPDAFNQVELPQEIPTPSAIMETPNGAVLNNGDFTSPNYIKGKGGWKIDSQGNAFFQNVTTATKLKWLVSTPIVNLDWSIGNVQSIILTTNTTFTWKDQGDGQILYLLLVQDSVGSRTVTWPTTVAWPGGTAPTLTTTANKADLIVLIRDSTNNLEYGYITSKNFECFLAGTMISTPNGNVPIETLKIGDVVISLGGKEIMVVKTIKKWADEYFVIKTSLGDIKVTGEHPFMLENGTFKKVKDLKVGDTFKNPQGARIESLGLERIAEATEVFNLTVEEPNVYIANGVYVHNKASPS